MNRTFHGIFAYISFVFWLAFGLYFGLAGILYADLVEEKAAAITEQTSASGQHLFTYKGAAFSTREKAAIAQQEDQASSIFSWFAYLPEKLILFITSLALGGLGGVIGIVKRMALGKASILEVKPFWIPMLGALIGILVLGVSYLLPVILTTSTEVEIRATTLIFVSMFAGLYSRQFLSFLESRFSSYLNKLDEQ